MSTKLTDEQILAESSIYNEHEDERCDIRNLLEFGKTAIGDNQIDGFLWEFQLRKNNFGIGELFGKEIELLPIVSDGLRKKIQDMKNKNVGRFGREVKGSFLT